MMDYENAKVWTKVHIDEIKIPRAGKLVHAPAYWIVTPDNHVLRFRDSAWQCNSNKELAEMLIPKLHPTCHIEYIEITFVDNHWMKEAHRRDF